MNTYKKIFLLAIVAAIATIAVYLTRCDSKQYFIAYGDVWTTEYHITYENTTALDDSIDAVLKRIDRSANVYNPKSLVSLFNENGTVDIDSTLTLLMCESRTVNKESEGLYDPTVMPLVKAWTMARKEEITPSKETIDSLIALIGLDKITTDNGRMTATVPGVQIDFSSIAKGFACDEIARMLERNGVKNYLVEIGGEVVASGVNSRGKKWHISVDMPTDQAEEVSHASALVLELDSASVATSGNYRQFKVVDGKRVTHIVNPITGEASQSDLLSVSIIAPHCVTADAWATACMVMGTDATQRMMENRSDLGVMTISTDSNGNYVVWSNKAFANKVVR